MSTAITALQSAEIDQEGHTMLSTTSLDVHARARKPRRVHRLLGVAASAAVAVSAAVAMPGVAGASVARDSITADASAVGPYAWAMADQPSVAGPYSPAAATQYNSTTSTSATVTRTSMGVYKVYFPGVATPGASGEGAGGTAFVSQGNCKTSGWAPGGASPDN